MHHPCGKSHQGPHGQQERVVPSHIDPIREYAQRGLAQGEGNPKAGLEPAIVLVRQPHLGLDPPGGDGQRLAIHVVHDGREHQQPTNPPRPAARARRWRTRRKVAERGDRCRRRCSCHARRAPLRNGPGPPHRSKRTGGPGSTVIAQETRDTPDLEREIVSSSPVRPLTPGGCAR